MGSVACIELGIFSRTFERGDLRSVLDAVVLDHFENVHINLKSASVDPFRTKLTPEKCLEIRREVEIRNLNLIGVSCTFNAIHPDLGRREQETALAAELITRIPELGASFASLSTGTRDPDEMWHAHPANDEPAAWSDLRRTLERLLESARAVNVTLGIEPERANVVSSARRARRLLDEFDTELLKIIFDPANLLTVSTSERQAEIVEEALELLAPDVHIVHAKDFSDTGDCGAGRGLLDYEMFFEQLGHHRVDASVVLHELEESDVVRARGFVLHAAQQAAGKTSGPSR